MMLQTQSRSCALSKVWMCDGAEAPAEEPAEEEKPSVLDTLDGVPAELLESIKGMTLLDASNLIKEVDKTFGLTKEDEEEEEEAAAA